MSISNGMRRVHPGEILREDYMLPLNLDVETFAKQLGIPLDTLKEILSENICIDLNVANKLAFKLDTTFDYWINLQKTYDSKA